MKVPEDQEVYYGILCPRKCRNDIHKISSAWLPNEKMNYDDSSEHIKLDREKPTSLLEK